MSRSRLTSVDGGPTSTVDGSDHIGGAVPPSQALELAIVHRLRPQRDTVDTRCPEGSQVADLVSTRVCLQRDLGLPGDPEAIVDVLEQVVQL